MQPTSTSYFAVVAIATGRLVGYRFDRDGRYLNPTKRDSRAAVLLTPGTCYGWGDTPDEAIADAVVRARQFREGRGPR